MYPISPVGVGYSSGMAGTRPSSNESVLSGASSGERPAPAASTGTGNLTALSELQTALSDMMGSLGLENDRLLKMMLGLIILMALLKGADQEREGAGQPLLDLGGQQGNWLLVGMSSSYTSVRIEQTTTISVSMDAAEATAYAQEAEDALGGRYDSTA
jgi:hypothetical protein